MKGTRLATCGRTFGGICAGPYRLPGGGQRAGALGLAPVHLSAQRKRYWWDQGYLGGVWGVFKAVVEGLCRRSGDALSVRNGSG